MRREFGQAGERKRKIFGLNSAKVYRVDPELRRCRLRDSDFAMMKKGLDSELGARRWTAKRPLGDRREVIRLAKWNLAKGVPG